jgi:hypothetical protein
VDPYADELHRLEELLTEVQQLIADPLPEEQAAAALAAMWAELGAITVSLEATHAGWLDYLAEGVPLQ